MFDNYSMLQHYWWFLVSLLAALLVFLMFVQGGQSLIWTLGRTEAQRRMLVNSTGRKWELTFTTLVTFGGAFFASFPLFYSTSFGGAYWVWMLILLCFVVQAVAYEFQHKKNNLLGATGYRALLVVNGVLGPVLIGTAVSTFFFGAEFIVNKAQLASPNAPAISQWAHGWHGLEAVLNGWNVCLGLAVFFLSRVLAHLYFMNNIDDAPLFERAKRRLPWESGLFLVFFLSYLVRWLTMEGFAVLPQTQEVVMQSGKYFLNLIEMPVVLILLLAGVVLVLTGIALTLLRPRFLHGIWFSGTGTVLTVLAMLLCAGWNGTAYYPSSYSLQSSLTIANSSSSQFTLSAMTIVSFFIPFVLAYIAYAWRALDRAPITEREIMEDQDAY